RDAAKSPEETDGQRTEQEQGRGEPAVRGEQKGEREPGGERGGERTVAKGRLHLVVRNDRPAGHPGAYVDKVGRQRADRATNGVDALTVAEKISFIRALCDEHEQQALVRGEVVPRVRIVRVSEREPRVPERDVGCVRIEACRDLVHDG